MVTQASAGIADMFAQPFMRNAFLAGTAIAAAAGLVGYFLVLRGQVFTGDALSHVAFTGALAGLALGIDARLGLFAATVVGGAAMASLGGRRRADDVAIGSVFSWVLGLGVLCLSIYTTGRSGANGAAGVNVLFGSIIGLSAGQARVAAVIGAGVAVAVLGIARPLLFSSVDEGMAIAHGVPARALGLGFLVLVGVTAAEATQAVGALLLLGLLAAPAGAAQHITTRPYRALGLSAALSAAAMWAGLTLSYLAPRIPPSFAITSVATGIYVVAVAGARATRPPRQTKRARRLPVGSAAPGAGVGSESQVSPTT